ncbi:hypothetical protein [Nitrobacter sp. TKz-YC02]|uniref:hypothetical protein n=1 Tax=Nitrobacter sp. TKz-YC02 TaxID=3398704 RepID=UPI003CF742F8
MKLADRDLVGKGNSPSSALPFGTVLLPFFRWPSVPPRSGQSDPAFERQIGRFCQWITELVVVEKRETIAHHEAGHAVIARVLDIPVSYATLDAHDGAGAVVTTSSATHLALDDLETPEKYAIVALAGPQAQHHYRPMSLAAQNHACEGGWRVDRANATSLLAMLVLRQHGKPAVPGSYVELDGPETEEFSRLFSRTTQKTADLVEENWPAIQRVAAALLSRPGLTEDDIDALIAAHDN